MKSLDFDKGASIAEGKVLAQYGKQQVAACVQGVDGGHGVSTHDSLRTVKAYGRRRQRHDGNSVSLRQIRAPHSSHLSDQCFQAATSPVPLIAAAG